MGRVDHKTCLYVFIFLVLLGTSGCAGFIDRLSGPWKGAAGMELRGPFDRDIPEKYITDLREASVNADWAIPYIFITIASHFKSIGDEIRSIYFYDRSIEEFRKRNDLYGEGVATTRQVIVLTESGKMDEALLVIRVKEQAWQKPPMKAFVSYSYGKYFLTNGDYEKALNYFGQAFAENPNFKDDFNLLMLRRDTELEAGMSIILANYVPHISKKYGWIEIDQTIDEATGKSIEEGILHLKQVLALNDEIRQSKIGNSIPEACFQILETDVYNFLGLAEGIRGNWAESHRYLNISLTVARKAGFRMGEIDSLFFLNQLYLIGKKIAEGQRAAEQLNEAADQYRISFYQVWAKYILSRYYMGFGNAQKAIDLLKQAVAIFEGQGSPLVASYQKGSYSFDRSAVYEALVDLLAREGDYRGSLAMAERAKAQDLADIFAGKDIGKNPVEAGLLKDQERIAGTLTYIQRIMFRTRDKTAADNLTEMFKMAEINYRDLLARMKKENEDLFTLVSVQAPDPAEIQNLLDENTTLFAYFVTDHLLYIWAVNKDWIHLERIKMEREELFNLLISFLSALDSLDKKKTNALSQKMYDILLKPIIPFVYGDRIGFIPHDILYYLPFAAMSYRGQYLVNGFSIFHLPNMGMLKYVMRKNIIEKNLAEGNKSGNLKIIFLGNPLLGDKDLDLPHAEMEGEKIKKQIGETRIFLREDVTKSKVKEMIDECDILHFAGRSQYRPETPMNSSLLLTPAGGDDGKLTALEISRLRFHGRAVVLSATEAGLDKSSTGKENLFLNRSFMYAGSPSVVSSLWTVNHKATATFIEVFYEHLDKKDDIADSLRQAQLDMIYRGYAPFYWAPFILMGKF